MSKALRLSQLIMRCFIHAHVQACLVLQAVLTSRSLYKTFKSDCLPPVSSAVAAADSRVPIADISRAYRYAAKAMKIKNKPVQNKNKMGALRLEVEMLRKQNQDYQVGHC